MGGLTPVVASPIPDIDLRRKPLLARTSTWATVAVVALVIGAGWYVKRGQFGRSAGVVAPPVVTATSPTPRVEVLDLAVQSNPSGADVFIAGEKEPIGKTPFRKKFDYREDKSTFLLFRIAGYRELTHEVRPDWSGLVVLDPLAPPPPPDIKPVPPVKPPKVGTSRPGSHPKNPKTDKDVDPFESKGKRTDIRTTGGRAVNPF
jgi:hypothetical protein